jgi:hypothetical protein
MYSGEFLKFLYGYQKEDFNKKEPKSYEIRFKNNGGGKPAKIYLTIQSK